MGPTKGKATTPKRPVKSAQTAKAASAPKKKAAKSTADDSTAKGMKPLPQKMGKSAGKGGY